MTTLYARRTSSIALLITMLASLSIKAQSTLEFTSSSASTTASGPSIASQAVTFYENRTNGSYAAFSSPTTTVTVSLSNQQYTMSNSQISTRTGSAFGAGNNSFGNSASSLNFYMQMNAIGGASAGNFTAAGSLTSGTGISLTSNYGIEIFNSALALQNAGRSTSGRWYMADLTIAFNTPVNNPVIHLAGLGATSSSLGFTTEFDLVTSNVSLSKLSGSSELTVTSTSILNNAANPAATTGLGAASGSVLVTGSNITSITFKMYMRGDGSSSFWSLLGHAGDGFLLSASTSTSSISTLPVGLTGFTAALENNITRLNWSTAIESNSSYFDVEYSTDNNSWMTIGTVQAAGNSTTGRTYAFTHTHPAAGNNFYRLRMIDQDGTFTYSKVDEVSVEEPSRITFYPNPVRSSCTVNTNSTTPQSLSLLTLDGRMLLQNNSFVSGGSIDLSRYPNGVYLLVLRSATGKSEVLKIMKD
ncbi:MAG: T9SS type A sorting domain-containing protein [Bacteroidetes bacterium]|nr:T9SS type A sorting domain-containing protein [Bacteroidota bacterium]